MAIPNINKKGSVNKYGCPYPNKVVLRIKYSPRSTQITFKNTYEKFFNAFIYSLYVFHSVNALVIN